MIPQSPLAQILPAVLNLIGVLVAQWVAYRIAYKDPVRPDWPDPTDSIERKRQLLTLLTSVMYVTAGFIFVYLVVTVVTPGIEIRRFLTINLELALMGSVGLLCLLALVVVANRSSFQRVDDGAHEPLRGGYLTRLGRTRWFKALVVIVASICCVSSERLLSEYVNWQSLPLHGKLAYAAWDRFQRDRFPEAIELARRCIADFEYAAGPEEARWQKDSPTEPPTGRIKDSDVTEGILKRGYVNDVATCLWIQGRSAENLGDLQTARIAYSAASKYPYARTWDPVGKWFWPPGIDAADRLVALPAAASVGLVSSPR